MDYLIIWQENADVYDRMALRSVKMTDIGSIKGAERVVARKLKDVGRMRIAKAT